MDQGAAAVAAVVAHRPAVAEAAEVEDLPAGHQDRDPGGARMPVLAREARRSHTLRQVRPTSLGA